MGSLAVPAWIHPQLHYWQARPQQKPLVRTDPCHEGPSALGQQVALANHAYHQLERQRWPHGRNQCVRRPEKGGRRMGDAERDYVAERRRHAEGGTEANDRLSQWTSAT